MNGDLCAAFRQLQRDAAANSPRATGHKSIFSRERHKAPPCSDPVAHLRRKQISRQSPGRHGGRSMSGGTHDSKQNLRWTTKKSGRGGNAEVEREQGLAVTRRVLAGVVNNV